MFTGNRRSIKRQSSKRASKQRSQAALGRLKPGLSLDTNFSRHIARAPEQVFPTSNRADGHARLQAPGAELGEEAIMNTPRIVVTSTMDGSANQLSPESPPKRRIPSSVYSRYTDVVPRSAEFEKTPPVPPLPFAIPKPVRRVGLGPFVSTSMKKLRTRSTRIGSVGTVFEEDVSPAQQGLSATTPSQRHSNGWWNFITSPFLPQIGTPSHRSPPSDEETPILQESRVLYTQDDIHSASSSFRSLVGSLNQPRRSVTAPSVFSTGSDGVDIYRVPSQGEAAAYYDLNKHFPSLIISPSEVLPISVFEDDTPCTSRAQSKAFSDDVPPIPPFPDHLLTRSSDPFTDQHTDLEKSRGLFTSPFADELKTPLQMPHIPTEPSSIATASFSPLSPSPVVSHAHIAHVIGPASFAEKDIKTPSPPTRSATGLGAATMASRSPSVNTASMPPQDRSFGHSRTSSYGLGITGSEVQLFPTPAHVEEKRELVEDETESSTAHPPWYRRFLWPIVALVTALLTLMIVLMVMNIPQHHTDIAVQAQWVNLTSYPPLPTGISTIAKPKVVRKEDGCASRGLWSCAVPSSADSPSFRLQIRFRNDSTLSGTQQMQKRSGGAVLLARDIWSDSLYTAKPAPPSTADQIFLGNTTDNTTAPFDGETTPFYITLLDATKLSAKLRKRQYPYPSDDKSSINMTTGMQVIPNAAANGDNTPATATLYPLVEAQPLRLYKRGQPDEHYGFYTYYDKTIYVSNSTNGSYISDTPISSTSAVCTWSQSRLLVQIWTRDFVTTLKTNYTGNTAADSSANDMSFPGSFPWATTITIDRHGGDVSSKGVYCHGVGANERLTQDVKTWIQEDRGFRGSLINPAPLPDQSGGRDTSSYGGIDGGDGGCACAWHNW